MEILVSLLGPPWFPEMLLGPLLLVLHGSPGDALGGFVACVVFLPFIVAGAIHPRWWSVPISLASLVLWALAGKLICCMSC